LFTISVATTPKPKETGYDLVVILDSSVSQEYFDWMTTFTKNLASTVSIDDEEFRVGLLRYSTDSDVQFHLNGYSSSGDVKNAVDGVNYKGGITNTAQAIDKARTDMFTRDQGDRDYARNFILLITGQDKSLSTNDAWRAAERAETDGIQLYVIGLNINDRVELDETSSHPLETYQYLTGSEKDLQDVPAQIYAGLLGSKCNFKLIVYVYLWQNLVKESFPFIILPCDVVTIKKMLLSVRKCKANSFFEYITSVKKCIKNYYI
jgi:collagen type VI alpha